MNATITITAEAAATMTVKELKAAAKAANIKGYSRMNKAALIAALTAADTAEAVDTAKIDAARQAATDKAEAAKDTHEAKVAEAAALRDKADKAEAAADTAAAEATKAAAAKHEAAAAAKAAKATEAKAATAAAALKDKAEAAAEADKAEADKAAAKAAEILTEAAKAAAAKHEAAVKAAAKAEAATKLHDARYYEAKRARLIYREACAALWKEAVRNYKAEAAAKAFVAYGDTSEDSIARAMFHAAMEDCGVGKLNDAMCDAKRGGYVRGAYVLYAKRPRVDAEAIDMVTPPNTRGKIRIASVLEATPESMPEAYVAASMSDLRNSRAMRVTYGGEAYLIRTNLRGEAVSKTVSATKYFNDIVRPVATAMIFAAVDNGQITDISQLRNLKYRVRFAPDIAVE